MIHARAAATSFGVETDESAHTPVVLLYHRPNSVVLFTMTTIVVVEQKPPDRVYVGETSSGTERNVGETTTAQN